jgi:hypothetical protein
MNLFDRAKNILITPKTEWEVIKGEPATTADLFTKYVMILAAIPAIAAFIGQSLVGDSLGPFGSYKLPIGDGLLYAVLQYVLTLVGVYAAAFVVDALAPSFGSTKDMIASLKVVVYSYTAAWIAGIFGIIPVLGILGLLGLYSLYLLYLGLKIVKDTPQDKLVGYVVVTIIVLIVIYFIIGAVVTAIAMPKIGGLEGLKNLNFGN